MQTRVLPLTLLAAVLVAFLHAVPAQAAPTRVFVAAQGSDTNACTFAAPCRGFQKAHDTVAAGGEIDVLDPSGYGTLIISKSISIQGHGFAGIAASPGVTAITITAGTGDAVSLRGLLIDGVGNPVSGIRCNSVGALTVQDTVIRNFGGAGIVFDPTVAGTTRLYITATRIFDIGTRGIDIFPLGSGKLVGVLNRVEVNHTGDDAVNIGAHDLAVNVEITQCVFTRAKATSLTVDAQSTFSVTARMTRTTLANSSHGYFVTGNAATLFTYGDNNISDNGSNSGTLTTFAHQ